PPGRSRARQSPCNRTRTTLQSAWDICDTAPAPRETSGRCSPKGQSFSEGPPGPWWPPNGRCLRLSARDYENGHRWRGSGLSQRVSREFYRWIVADNPSTEAHPESDRSQKKSRCRSEERSSTVHRKAMARACIEK